MCDRHKESLDESGISLKASGAATRKMCINNQKNWIDPHMHITSYAMDFIPGAISFGYKYCLGRIVYSFGLCHRHSFPPLFTTFVFIGRFAIFIWGSMVQGCLMFMPTPTDYQVLTSPLVLATAKWFGIRLLCDVDMEILFLVFQYNNNIRDLGLLVPRELRISPYSITLFSHILKTCFPY